jgi:hypothetical protein
MATQKYALQFTIVDEIILPEEVDRHADDIIKQIIAYTEINAIEPDGFEPYNPDKGFNKHDNDESIAKTQTIITVIFDASPDMVNVKDSNAAAQLYVQALQAIKDNPNAKITGHYYREQLPRSLTVIQITVA